jgi:hypothetical protein
MARTALHLHCTALEWGEREESRRGGDARRLLSSPSRQEKNLLQPGCKPGRLQPLTKMRIDPTCRSIIQQKRYLVDLQVGPILISVRGCKRPGLQPGCNKFFSSRHASLPFLYAAWTPTPDTDDAGKPPARLLGRLY